MLCVVIEWSGWLVTQASHARFTYVLSGPQTDTSRGWSLYCGGKERTVTPFCLQYSNASTDKCESWLSNKRFTCLSFGGLALLRSVLRVLQNDPPSSTQMDGPCVKSVDCTLCSVTVLVRCFLRQSVVPCCSILPKYEKESENPSPRSSLTFHVFAQLSRLVAVRQGVCCFYLNFCRKYTLFSFLKWR